eukprot:2013029-Pyramimonas_sp.AAC.1
MTGKGPSTSSSRPPSLSWTGAGLYRRCRGLDSAGRRRSPRGLACPSRPRPPAHHRQGSPCAPGALQIPDDPVAQARD